MTTTEDMTEYDPDTDPREVFDRTVPLVTGEAPWLLQVSVKTPAGTLINVRGMEGMDIAAGLAAISGISEQVTALEEKFRPVVPQALQGVAQPVAPAQSQYQQPQGGPQCQCGFPAKYVKGGVSKKTNRPYQAFYCCGNPNRDAECSFRANG